MSTNYTKLSDLNNNGYYEPHPSHQPPQHPQHPQQHPQYPQYPQQPHYFQDPHHNNQFNGQYPPPQNVYYVNQQSPQPPNLGFSASVSTSVSASVPSIKLENGDADVIPACILLGLGLIFYVPLIINIIYVKSKNSLARAVAITSVVLFFLAIVVVIGYLIIFFAFFYKVNNIIDNATSNWASNNSCYYYGSC